MTFLTWFPNWDLISPLLLSRRQRWNYTPPAPLTCTCYSLFLELLQFFLDFWVFTISKEEIKETNDIHVCFYAKSLQSCPTVCDPMDCSPPGSSVHGDSPRRVLEWVATPSSGGVFLTQGFNPRLLCLLHWAGKFFTTSATWEAQYIHTFSKNMQTYNLMRSFSPKKGRFLWLKFLQ